ncbi:MAG: 6-phosphogluconolactonase [Magnetococcus sp. WYHC-3]
MIHTPFSDLMVRSSPDAALDTLVDELFRTLEQTHLLRLAISGGQTPRRLFHRLGTPPLRDALPWDRLELFWVDERCVPPHHPDSNFGAFREALGGDVPLPAARIHRLRGEADPPSEAARYATLLRDTLEDARRPLLDWVWLGMGSDGHVASLFPLADSQPDPSGLCAVTRHPQSGQTRITLTLAALEAARRITVLVTGNDKADMLARVFGNLPDASSLPALRLRKRRPDTRWLCDAEAARVILEGLA